MSLSAMFGVAPAGDYQERILARKAQMVGRVPADDRRRQSRKSKPVHERDSAVWADGKQCCRKRNCCSLFSPTQVLKIRKVTAQWGEDGATLASANRKAWSRSRVTRQTPGKRDREYRLDLPAFLEQDNYVSPLDVRESATLQVCSTFYSWATTMSPCFVSSAYEDRQPGARAAARGSGSAKQIWALSWLANLGAQYQQSPDSDLIMLPFVDKQ
jgi:hypothetical protein